jgi:hypothetical protein
MAKKPDAPKAPSRLDDRTNMQIVFRPIDKLVPYARNARTHSDAQLAQIAGAMREFGWTNPVLLDESDGIIAGHGRILAARKLGLKQDIPCIVLAGLSDAQKRALVIADNKLALNAGWDNDMLTMELGDITTDGFDLGIIGFSPNEMNAMLGLDGPRDGDPGVGAGAGVGEGDPYKEQYAVIVMCKSEADQERVFNELQTQGYNIKVVNT